MKNIRLYILYILFPLSFLAQNQQLADDYFDKGQLEKALIIYEDLYKSNNSSKNFDKIIKIYQQLQQFDKAEKELKNQYNRFKLPSLLVELGYNYQLQKKDVEAKKYYDQAVEVASTDNSYNIYSIANAFESKVLLNYALNIYLIGEKLYPQQNYDYQIAMLYGQLGDVDKMLDRLLDFSYKYRQNSLLVRNYLDRFINDDLEGYFNAILRNALLLKAQRTQDIFWNEFLTWFYVRQKDYKKAFIQEKAIYKRESESLYNIVNLATLVIEDNDDELSSEILTYILENTQELELKVYAHKMLLNIKIENAQEKDYNNIELELQALINQLGISSYTLPLQIEQAHFLAFYLNKPDQAKAVLDKALKISSNSYDTAEVKMEIADILLYQEKFNQALIYYSQIEDDLKNDAIGHEASLKIAKTSYFKGDFKWAERQLKVLKSSYSQLIANDALDLYLLITDNTVADSTQAALTAFARADFLKYQNKNRLALEKFQQILEQYKGEIIEGITLFRIAQLQESLREYEAALRSYKQIIDYHVDSIYIDEALFFSAEIYNYHLKQADKAKLLYEKLLFDHQDSIYFIEARKNYRQLRGDAI